jgi:hypothetical protein
MSKTDQKRLLKAVSNLLTARRNGHVPAEQAAYDKLSKLCASLNVDLGQAIDQGRAYLASHSAAAIMGSIV